MAAVPDQEILQYSAQGQSCFQDQASRFRRQAIQLNANRAELDRSLIRVAQQHHLTAAATLARSIAGDDDTRFAVVFHALANHVETLAAGDRNSNFEQTRAQLLAARDSSRRATASTTGATDNALLYSDRVYLENLDALGSAKTAIVGGELTTDFPDCVAVGSAKLVACSMAARTGPRMPPMVM